MLTPTATEARALRMLDVSRPYQVPRDPEQIRQDVLAYLLRKVTPDILGTCTNIALTVFDRTVNDPHQFDEAVHAQLVAVKDAINADLDEKMTVYRAQLKVVSQASLRLYALQVSKSPSKEAILAAEEVVEAEQEVFAPIKAALLDAQRAEHYIRMIPSVYKSQDADDAIWAIGFYLRTNMWNPKAPTTAHADAEAFIRPLFK